MNADYWIGFLTAWCLINGMLAVACVVWIIRRGCAAKGEG